MTSPLTLGSRNEWAPLRAAVVGTVDGFTPGVEVDDRNEGVLAEALAAAAAAYPRWYLDEVAEDLEGLCDTLRRAGVEVLRPRWTEARAEFTTPNWSAAGFDIYNVRDLHLVVGNTLVASASPTRFRLFERYALHDLLYERFFDQGFRWISAPLPRLRGSYVHELTRAPSTLESQEDSLQARLSGGRTERHHMLDEAEVLFDAANVIRLGDDLLYLVSSTGNRRGARWLQSALGTGYRVHVTDAYRASHLDSTILPLRPGLVLLNAARVTDATCPAPLGGWDRIYFSDVAPLPAEELELHESLRLPAARAVRALGARSTLEHVSSPWAGLNVLSLDPDTVVVHDRQSALIRELERRGLTVIPQRMRHCYTMLGGLHCVTLDVVREAA